MLLMAPSNENETRQSLYTGFMHDGPAAVRYPRGTGPGVQIEKEMQQLPIGKANIVRHGTQVAILNFGTLLNSVIDLSDEICLLYTSPSPRDLSTSRMPSSA